MFYICRIAMMRYILFNPVFTRIFSYLLASLKGWEVVTVVNMTGVSGVVYKRLCLYVSEEALFSGNLVLCLDV